MKTFIITEVKEEHLENYSMCGYYIIKQEFQAEYIKKIIKELKLENKWKILGGLYYNKLTKKLDFKYRLNRDKI